MELNVSYKKENDLFRKTNMETGDHWAAQSIPTLRNLSLLNRFFIEENRAV